MGVTPVPICRESGTNPTPQEPPHDSGTCCDEWPALTLFRDAGCEPGTSQSGFVRGEGRPRCPVATAEAAAAVLGGAPARKALLMTSGAGSAARLRANPRRPGNQSEANSAGPWKRTGSELPNHPSDPWPQGARRRLQTTQRGESSTRENSVPPQTGPDPDPAGRFAQGEASDEPPEGPVHAPRQAAVRSPESPFQADRETASGRNRSDLPAAAGERRLALPPPPGRFRRGPFPSFEANSVPRKRAPLADVPALTSTIKASYN